MIFMTVGAYMFFFLFFSYAFFHATRKTFSNVKSTISDEWSPSYHNNTVNYTKPDQVMSAFCLYTFFALVTLSLLIFDFA